MTVCDRFASRSSIKACFTWKQIPLILRELLSKEHALEIPLSTHNRQAWVHFELLCLQLNCPKSVFYILSVPAHQQSTDIGLDRFGNIPHSSMAKRTNKSNIVYLHQLRENKESPASASEVSPRRPRPLEMTRLYLKPSCSNFLHLGTYLPLPIWKIVIMYMLRLLQLVSVTS